MGSRGQAPRIREMLPGESSEGTFTFDVKDGVEPVELVLQLAGYRPGVTIRCGANRAGLRDALLPTEVRIDVRDIPAR
jgi:hypothetical protein